MGVSVRNWSKMWDCVPSFVKRRQPALCSQVERTGENVDHRVGQNSPNFWHHFLYQGWDQWSELMIILEQMCEGGHPAKIIMLMAVQTLSKHMGGREDTLRSGAEQYCVCTSMQVKPVV